MPVPRRTRYFVGKFQRQYSTTDHLLGAVTDGIVGEDIAAAAHREPDAVLVVLECVPANLGSEGLEQCYARVSIAVHVVVWGDGTFSLWDNS